MALVIISIKLERAAQSADLLVIWDCLKQASSCSTRMLTADGKAKISDFGLAVAIDRSRLPTEWMMVVNVLGYR